MSAASERAYWQSEDVRIARKALADRFEPEIDKVKRRIIQIDTEIEAKGGSAAARYWGAAITALNEERKHVAVLLMWLEKEEANV